MRFWVDDYKKKEVLQQLGDAGYEPIFLKMELQPDIRSYSIGLVNSFELPIAADRVSIYDNRILDDEVGKRGRDAEIKKIYEQIYGKQRS